MSIKSIVSVAVVLGPCVQAQAGPKRRLDPQDEPRSLYHRDDMKSHSRDIQAGDRLLRESEDEAKDNGDPNKGWAYDLLFMRRSLYGHYSYVYPTRYGMFASKDECEQARAERINRMESDPEDPTGPVKYPIQAWYSETPKTQEHTSTQVANSGGTQSTQTGQTQVSGSAKVSGGLQQTLTGQQPQVSGSGQLQSTQTDQTQASSSGGMHTSTEKEQTKGGAQHAMLVKHCMAYTYRQVSPGPRPLKSPSGAGGRRTENQ